MAYFPTVEEFEKELKPLKDAGFGEFQFTPGANLGEWVRLYGYRPSPECRFYFSIEEMSPGILSEYLKGEVWDFLRKVQPQQ